MRCAPPPPLSSFFGEPPTKFSRGGGGALQNLILEGVGGKGGMTFLRGKLQFLQEK